MARDKKGLRRDNQDRQESIDRQIDQATYKGCRLLDNEMTLTFEKDGKTFDLLIVAEGMFDDAFIEPNLHERLLAPRSSMSEVVLAELGYEKVGEVMPVQMLEMREIGSTRYCEDYPCCGHEQGDCDGSLYGSNEEIKARAMREMDEEGGREWDEDEGCEGHPAGPFDPAGVDVFCDGSCRSVGRLSKDDDRSL